MRYASRTWSGSSTSGSGDTPCWISPIGKIGVRSSGPAGCIVPGLSGGIGSPGRSGSRFTQCVGISDSGSRYLTVSSLTRSSPLRCGAILWRKQPADQPRDVCRLLREPPSGDPYHPVAGGLKHGVALAVSFECAAVAVELPTVELDDEALRRPEGIHEVALHEYVARRRRQVERAAQVEEASLELAPRIGDHARPVLEQGHEVLEPAAAVAVLAGRFDGPQVEEPPPRGGVPGSRETMGVRLRKVKQRPRDARDRDVVPNRPLGLRQMKRRMHTQPSTRVRA